MSITDIKIELSKNPQTILKENLTLIQSISPYSNISDPASLESLIANLDARDNYSINKVFMDVIKAIYIDTASGIDLDNLAKELRNLTRNNASSAKGFINIEGVVNSTVYQNTEFLNNGNIYKSLTDVTITNQNLLLQSATYDNINSKVIITTANPHNLASGITVAITGYSTTNYNGTNLIITKLDEYTFSYLKTGITIMQATGSGIATFIIARVEVESNLQGKNQNIDGGSLTLVNANTNITNIFVQNGISGGADIELDDDFRARYYSIAQSYQSNDSQDALKNLSKEISGVTRVKVLPTTPSTGYCTILFMRDDDFNPIPNQSAINQVKSYLTRTSVFPPHLDATERLIVNAPTPSYQTISIVFSQIISTSLNSSVKANIASLFSNLDIGEGVSRNKVISTIEGSVGIDGSTPPTFSLILPALDITILANQVIILNNIIIS